MEIETSRVHDPVYHRGRVHSSIRHSEGSRVVTLTINRLLGEKTTRPFSTDHLLWFLERNTPHPKSSLSREDKTYWGAVSSHPGTCNIEETWSQRLSIIDPNEEQKGKPKIEPDNESIYKLTLTFPLPVRLNAERLVIVDLDQNCTLGLHGR